MGLNTARAEVAWLAPPRAIPLPDGEIHLWQTATNSFATHASALTALLSEAELDKANRFRQTADRNRSILARALLRDILGRYMDMDPCRLEFLVSERGKPMLDPKVHPDAPHFSLSHSGDIVLLGFCRTHPLGVDVEAIRDNVDALEIAQRFFAPAELDALRGLPEATRATAFFDGWTRKEAYLKARGEGISYGLEKFSITLAPGEPARLISDERHPQEVGSWHLHNIALRPDYAAACAIHSGDFPTRQWLWRDPA